MNDTIMVAYAWGFGNMGDAAIAPGLLTLLERRFPEHKLAVVAEADHEQIGRYLRRDFPNCDVLANGFAKAYERALMQARRDFMGNLSKASADTAKYALESFAHNAAAALEATAPDFLERLRAAGLLVYTSGMVLVYGKGTLAGTDFWGYTLPRSFPLLMARELGIPYGVYAHSFDSFGGEPGISYLPRLLDDAAFVFCRDGDSLDYLHSLGMRKPGVMFVPDSTLSFAIRDDRWAAEYMAKHKLAAKRFMVVVPRTWFGGQVMTSSIGERRMQSAMGKLRDLIEGWVRRMGMKVVIALEVRKERPNALSMLYNPLSPEAKKECVMMETFWLPEQAAALYRQARFVVTMDLHSFLLAVPQGTPALVPTCLAESGRKIWMLKDFGMEELLIDIDAASTAQIEHALYKANTGYDGVTKWIKDSALPHLRKREARALDVMAKALGQS